MAIVPLRSFAGRNSYPADATYRKTKTPAVHSFFLLRCMTASKGTSSAVAHSSCIRAASPLPHQSLRYAVLGAGFAGLSVAWHLLESLQYSPKDIHVSIDIFDEFGVGGGASGSSGGLLHPYSPKVKPLWRGAECWRESLRLLGIAEEASGCLIKRRGIIRPAVSLKHLNILKDNAQNFLTSCRIEQIDLDATRMLVPGLLVPLNLSFFMPEAISIHPQLYLESLFQACKNAANHFQGRDLCLHRKPINDLLELEGEFDAVIVCLGARATFLPQLIGKLPLRTCRGVITHLQLPQDNREDFLENSPSILSDAWLAIKGNRDLHLGSTWEWNSNNYSSHVSAEESSQALEELLPKASGVYPGINRWTLVEAFAGLRAMPPITVNGSLPLLGSIDHIIGGNRRCRFWLFSGLGARGLLYHAWLGKLLAQAVLSCNEDLLPSELTTWKMKLKQR